MPHSNNDPIGKALNLAPLQSSDMTVKSIISQAHNDSAKNDFEIARSNIHEVIENGVHAIEKLSQIADSSQHPRAFEVYGTLLKNVVDANKELLAIQKQMRTMDGKQKDGDTKIDKAIFVGSTAELNKFLKAKE